HALLKHPHSFPTRRSHDLISYKHTQRLPHPTVALASEFVIWRPERYKSLPNMTTSLAQLTLDYLMVSYTTWNLIRLVLFVLHLQIGRAHVLTPVTFLYLML